MTHNLKFVNFLKIKNINIIFLIKKVINFLYKFNFRLNDLSSQLIHCIFFLMIFFNKKIRGNISNYNNQKAVILATRFNDCSHVILFKKKKIFL